MELSTADKLETDVIGDAASERGVLVEKPVGVLLVGEDLSSRVRLRSRVHCDSEGRRVRAFDPPVGARRGPDADSDGKRDTRQREPEVEPSPAWGLVRPGAVEKNRKDRGACEREPHHIPDGEEPEDARQPENGQWET